MIEDKFLPYFIDEPIFHVDEQIPLNNDSGKPDESQLVKEPETPISNTKSEPETAELAIWTPPLTKQDRELLKNILKAIKKDFSEARLMEGISGYQPHFNTLICFGYHQELELKVGEKIDMNKPVEIDGRSFLSAAAPADLHTDKKQKALLWEALQSMFL